MGAESFQKNMEKGLIEVAPLAYMRGRTLDNAFIILDEAQNTTPAQMKMFLTRIGFGSKAVITGDATQKDLAPDAHRLGHCAESAAQCGGDRYLRTDKPGCRAASRWCRRLSRHTRIMRSAPVRRPARERTRAEPVRAERVREAGERTRMNDRYVAKRVIYLLGMSAQRSCLRQRRHLSGDSISTSGSSLLSSIWYFWRCGSFYWSTAG